MMIPRPEQRKGKFEEVGGIPPFDDSQLEPNIRKGIGHWNWETIPKSLLDMEIDDRNIQQ